MAGDSVGKQVDFITIDYYIMVYQHFHYFQNVSCYGLLSKEPIMNPKLIDKKITLPFYPGYRYAAIPGASNLDDSCQVDIYSARPEHLVYHDHVLHIGDLKVAYF